MRWLVEFLYHILPLTLQGPLASPSFRLVSYHLNIFSVGTPFCLRNKSTEGPPTRALDPNRHEPPLAYWLALNKDIISQNLNVFICKMGIRDGN